MSPYTLQTNQATQAVQTLWDDTSTHTCLQSEELHPSRECGIRSASVLLQIKPSYSILSYPVILCFHVRQNISLTATHFSYTICPKECFQKKCLKTTKVMLVLTDSVALGFWLRHLFHALNDKLICNKMKGRYSIYAEWSLR